MPSLLRGWKDLGSDVNWRDYGGRWGRRCSDGSWVVVRFENKEEWGDGAKGFYCDVLHVYPNQDSNGEIDKALSCIGLKRTKDGLVSDSGDVIEAKYQEQVIVEAKVSYGDYSYLTQEESPNHAARLRAYCLRYGNQFAKE